MVKRRKNNSRKKRTRKGFKANREPTLGHYSMVVGVLMLLFIGFNRIWHFTCGQNVHLKT